MYSQVCVSVHICVGIYVYIICIYLHIYLHIYTGASLVAQMVNNLPAVQEIQV